MLLSANGEPSAREVWATDIWLAVDVGTTELKAGAFDSRGQLLARGEAGYALSVAADGQVEQAPVDWWGATLRSLRTLGEQIDLGQLTAVCIGGQSPTLLALDRAGEPLRPAITWLDTRAAVEAEELARALGTPAFQDQVAKAWWLARHEPDTFRRTARFAQSWDWLGERFSGRPVCSAARAVPPWPAAARAAAGLPGEQFPCPAELGAPIGGVSAEAARATGIRAGTPIIGGCGDFYAALIGAGAIEPGAACDVGGTSTSFNLCAEAPTRDPMLRSLGCIVPGRWHVGGMMSTTGSAFGWLRERVLADPRSPAELDAEAATVAPGADGLLFLPYLAGERTPIWDAKARAAFVGLSLQHTRAHCARAVLEGVAYGLRQIVERLRADRAPLREIRACGGQARSALWNQIKADVIGAPVVATAVHDAGLTGLAIAAARGVGAVADWPEAVQAMVRLGERFEPRPSHGPLYDAAFARYERLYPALKPIYQGMRPEA